MHRTLALLLVALLATVALAAPTAKQASPNILKKRSFTIPRIRKTGYIRKPSEAMGRAYRKFGWSMTTPDGSPWVAVSKTPTTMNLHADTSAPSNTTSSDQSVATNDRHLSDLRSWLYATFSWGYETPAASSAVAAPSTQVTYAAASSAAYSSAIVSSAAVSYAAYSSAATSYTVTTSATAAATATPAPANAAPAPDYAAPAPSADGNDETGEVLATPADNGAEYLSPVTIGGQKLNLNFDTGSSDLYVWSLDCMGHDRTLTISIDGSSVPPLPAPRSESTAPMILLRALLTNNSMVPPSASHTVTVAVQQVL